MRVDPTVRMRFEEGVVKATMGGREPVGKRLPAEAADPGGSYSKNGMRAFSGEARSAMSTATPSSPFQSECGRCARRRRYAAAWLASWRARLSHAGLAGVLVEIQQRVGAAGAAAAEVGVRARLVPGVPRAELGELAATRRRRGGDGRA